MAGPHATYVMSRSYRLVCRLLKAAAMMTRWLLAAFVLITILGSAALTLGGCDEDNPAPSPDLSVVPDLSEKG